MTISDSQMHGVVARHLNAALGELNARGTTDENPRTYLLEVLAEARRGRPGRMTRWDVVQRLLTDDHLNLTDQLRALIEMRSIPADDEYARGASRIS